MSELAVRGALSPDDCALAQDLMAKTFGPDYFTVSRRLDTLMTGYPAYQREHTRVAYRQGQLAGALRITTDTIRIGEARLKMGGLGWIAVSAEFRGQGVASALIGDALAYMRRNNYHVSMLFGIVDFYHRFGFTTMLSDYQTAVDVLEAEHAEHAPYKVRQGKPGDIAAIQKLHNAGENEVACSIVRSAAHLSIQWDRWKAVRVLTDDRGKVVAYFLPRLIKEGLLVEELGLASRDVCGALLHACAAHALDHHAPQIRFAAPPCHTFLKYLLQFESKYEMHVRRNRDGMLAIVNLEETLESMLPEWESGLARSALLRERTEVTLLVEKKPYRIRANRGAIDVTPGSGENKMSLSMAEFVQLLSGYRYLDEILDSRRRILNTQGKALLRVLFPKRLPFVWPLDHF